MNVRVQSQLIEEFTEALEAEVTALRKKSYGNAMPLSNGKIVSKNAGQYQYIFTIDSMLNVPEGSPSELIIQGRPTIEATIVSVEDLRVTISVNDNLGDFVPSAKLQSDLSTLLKKLIDRIVAKSEKENVVGLRMLGHSEVQGNIQEIIFKEKDKLNDAQKNAVSSAVSRNMTFIWGPPGTGKTSTIGKIIHELYKRNRSALLVSHTNTAVDQALMKFAEKINRDLESGYIIRVGSPNNPELGEKYPQVILDYQKSVRSKELDTQLQSKKEHLKTVKGDINKLDNQINETFA